MGTDEKQKPTRSLTPIRATLSAIGIYIAAQIIAVSVLALFAGAMGVSSDDFEFWLSERIFAKLVLYIMVAAVGVLGVWLIVRRTKQKWATIGVNRPKWGYLLSALAGYGAYFVLYLVSVILVGLIVPGVDFEQDQQLDFNTAISGLGLIAAFISLVVLPPIYEEILTRGLLYTGLRAKLQYWPAAIITSILFAAAHLQWGSAAPLLWAAAVDTFVLSMVLVHLREKTGSLWPCMGVHAIKNLVAFLLLFVFHVS